MAAAAPTLDINNLQKNINQPDSLRNLLQTIDMTIYEIKEILPNESQIESEVKEWINNNPSAFLKLNMTKANYDRIKNNIPTYGIKNEGNTCFMNAGFQALLSLPIFHSLISGLPNPSRDQPFQDFIMILKNSLNYRGQILIIPEIKMCYKLARSTNLGAVLTEDARLREGSQGDALTDFIPRLLQILTTSYFPIAGNEKTKTLLEHIITTSTMKCFSYNIIDNTTQESVDCNDLRSIINHDANLSQSISRYLSTLEFRDAVPLVNVVEDREIKKVGIYVKIPIVLSHLIIVNINNIDNQIQYDVNNLDILDINISNTQGLKKRYELLACVIRNAQGANGGHYTCLAKRKNTWIYFDDSTTLDTGRTNFAAAANPYRNQIRILFYHEIPQR